jgi:hypothetical protein
MGQSGVHLRTVFIEDKGRSGDSGCGGLKKRVRISTIGSKLRRFLMLPNTDRKSGPTAPVTTAHRNKLEPLRLSITLAADPISPHDISQVDFVEIARPRALGSGEFLLPIQKAPDGASGKYLTLELV